jgi:hypothetical protein
MIAQQSISWSCDSRATPWRKLFDFAIRLARSAKPVLPYAMLWEASLVVNGIRQCDYFAPDPYSTEAPFLRDAFPLSGAVDAGI